MTQLRIGTSGWNYPSGRGTWNGLFYPDARMRRQQAKGDIWDAGLGAAAPATSKIASKRGGSARAERGRTRPSSGTFDQLGYYAEHFNTVEVNSSFYRTPSPATTLNWARRTPANFEFSLKLYQKFTHPKMFETATGESHSQISQGDVDEFKAAIDPIAASGKLGALLAQFPASFKHDEWSHEYLEWLLETFKEYPVAVELRHRSWSDQIDDTLKLLNGYGAAFVQIDEPKFKVSIRQNFSPNVRGFYYVRLHGRNAANWWRHERSEDRYDYLYSQEELEPFAETAEVVKRLVKKFYLYFNNHFSAKAVVNAAMLLNALDQDVPGTYPEPLLERYPFLREIVTTNASEGP